MIVKGQKISDRYLIIKNIGEGGMANVYLANDTILDREVAVKVLRGDLSTDEKFVRRFQREALAASSLSNQNIVEVYDVGEDDGEYYIVMEYIKGTHLKTLIKKRGKLSISEVVDISLQITNGLSVAHDSYLIHRDIKPQNILILDNGLIKITDFGIAVAMNATQLTQTNSVMGSVHYLPPEQAMGKNSSLQSDIYSIGILMYELLAGKLPFTGDNAVEIALKHLKESVPLITDEVASVPRSLENIIIRATAKNPKNRYPDARTMHEDIKMCLDESRKDEKPIKLKFPENDYDESKVMKIVNNNNEEEENNDEDEKETVVEVKSKPKKKKGNKILIGLTAILAILMMLVVVIMNGMVNLSSNEQAIIPDVAGLSISEATIMLQEAGFMVADSLIEISSSAYDEDLIVKTNPGANSSRKKGYEVTMYVSIGDVSLTIDDYIGKNSIEIKGALTALGLQVLIEQQEVDNTSNFTADEIIGQSVEAGKTLSEGDIITLYVPLMNTYPDFLNEEYTLEKVEEFASDNNLILTVEEVVSDTYVPGAIFYQSRTAGSTIVSGFNLKVKVAIEKPEEEEVVPDEPLVEEEEDSDVTTDEENSENTTEEE
ncbi:MAG: Stk1 family PASTA domain-containing Ser/Thr kinase [bacterium]